MSEAKTHVPSAWPCPLPTQAPIVDARTLCAWLAEREGSRLALDVEADGMFRYRARLCTVQLSDVARIAVVDSLAVPPCDCLVGVLADAGVTKVVHDAAFDARLLSEHGAPLVGVFDTAVAARYLGYSTTGLAAILERHFGVCLDKEQQQADWAARPLDAAALSYLHEDVRYLLGLADILQAELVEADIVAEFQAECAYVVQQAARGQRDSRPPWMRVKGAAKLRPRARAVLREVAQVREELACARDVPPGRLVANGLLIALAERAPRSLTEMAKLLRRTPLSDSEVGALCDAVARGRAASDVPADELAVLCPPPPPVEVRQLHKRRRAALMSLRTREAEQRGVDPQVVLPGHCVKDLTAIPELGAAAVARTSGLGDCRVERYGRAILEALQSAEG